MQISGLFIYPVKSLRGFPVSSAQVDELGFVGDRRFLVIDERGRTLTQRDVPTMATIGTKLTNEQLLLSSAKSDGIEIPLRGGKSAGSVKVSVWSSKDLLADDCGDEAARWLSATLGVACRLVRIGQDFVRPVLDATRSSGSDFVSFADAYPFLVIGDASMAALNLRLKNAGEEPVPVNRFRPNLVVAGCAAHAEDTWARIRVGDVSFRAGGPCGRCTVTTTDQSTGARGKEPLRTLASYRRDPARPNEINFGQNLIHETKRGSIQVGDLVQVL